MRSHPPSCLYLLNEKIKGASTDYRDINGLTSLYYSILHRAELKVTQLLLAHMSKLDSSDEHTSTETQSKRGNNSIGISDQQGWQEVHHACKLGLDAHLDKLIYYGCDINAKISGSGNTPLHVAAINDQLQVIIRSTSIWFWNLINISVLKLTCWPNFLQNMSVALTYDLV